MVKLIVILLVALTFEAIGVVWLSQGLKEIGELDKFSASAIFQMIGRGVVNPWLLLGVLFETIFFVTLLYLLKNWDVSLIWPLTSLGFLLTTAAAKFIRHEEINTWRWSGVGLIVIGAMLVGYSERAKKGKVEAQLQTPELKLGQK
ncbi:MAG TPA: EamA family transporter [Candidatus Saccharimonadales bacterium]|nr:EamA family transporter [Candidatus Saccharimonadales bacterium]